MADEYLYRTAVTRLDADETAAAKLHDVIDAWQAGCALATEYAWPDTTSPGTIQEAVYEQIRAETGLKSQHSLLVCHHVAEALSSLAERRSNGQPVSKPTFTAPTVTYDKKTMTLFDDGRVSLTTLDSRAKCELILPTDADGYQAQYLAAGQWELTESTLTYRDGEFYLHLGFRRPRPPEVTTEHRTVLGVDLGIEQLAVTSTGRFFSGKAFNHHQREAVQREQELQLVDTRSAHRTLSRIHRRRRRRGRERLHRVANGLIEEALEHDATVIAFEELTGITERLAGSTAVQRWAFRTLIEFTRYRAKERGLLVVRVDPAHTSQRCSRTDCGHTADANRPVRERFCCVECGYEVHADYNAAKNIGLRCVRRGHTSSRRTGVSQCALKSGTLSPTEGFTDKSTPG